MYCEYPTRHAKTHQATGEAVMLSPPQWLDRDRAARPYFDVHLAAVQEAHANHRVHVKRTHRDFPHAPVPDDARPVDIEFLDAPVGERAGAFTLPIQV